MIHCTWFWFATPRACPMTGKAGSMESMAMACVDIIAAASTTNSVKPIFVSKA